MKATEGSDGNECGVAADVGPVLNADRIELDAVFRAGVVGEGRVACGGGWSKVGGGMSIGCEEKGRITGWAGGVIAG